MRSILLVFGLAGVLSAALVPKRDLAYLYRSTCAACHGLDGTAKSPAGVRLPGRILADRAWLSKQTKEELIHTIQEGKRAMPAFKEKLSTGESHRLLTEIIEPLARKGRGSNLKR